MPCSASLLRQKPQERPPSEREPEWDTKVVDVTHRFIASVGVILHSLSFSGSCASSSHPTPLVCSDQKLHEAERGTMSTSSTATDLTHAAQIRSRAQVLQGAYNISTTYPRPEYVISAKYGSPPLQNEDLLSLADSFAKIERVLFQMSDAGYKAILHGILNKDDAAPKQMLNESHPISRN